MNTKRVIQYFFAVGLIILFVFIADTKTFIAALSSMQADVLIVFLLISFILVGISSIKWQLFLKHLTGEAPSLFYLIKLYIVGYFVNGFLPSYLGGDVARSYYLGKKLGHHDTAAATILERYTGIISLISLGVISGLISDAIPLLMEVLMILLFVGVILATIFIVNVDIQKLSARIPKLSKYTAHTLKVQKAIKLGVTHPGLMSLAIILSLLFHAVAVLNTAIAGYAMGWINPPLVDIGAVLPFILLMGSLPLLPQGLGLQEGAFFYFLQIVGATGPQAIGAALLLRAKIFILAAIGWLLWLGVNKKQG